MAMTATQAEGTEMPQTRKDRVSAGLGVVLGSLKRFSFGVRILSEKIAISIDQKSHQVLNITPHHVARKFRC